MCLAGAWDKSGAKILPIGTAEHPVRRMLAVGSGRIWCTTRNVVKIIDVADMEVKVGADIVYILLHQEKKSLLVV